MITLSGTYCIFPDVHWNEITWFTFEREKKTLYKQYQKKQRISFGDIWTLKLPILWMHNRWNLRRGPGGVLGGLIKKFLGGTWGCDKIYVVFYFLVLLPFFNYFNLPSPPMPPSPCASMASPLNYQQGIHFFLFFAQKGFNFFFQRFFFHRFCLFISN